MSVISRQEILEANQAVHSALVREGNYQESPHFLEENVLRVRDYIIKNVLPKLTQSDIYAIDFGCGTGFMINILLDLASRIDGVDITKDMLDEVNTSSGKVHLHLAEAEKTPFENNRFDLATAYSFMDHLENAEPFLEEVYRVLKPGGVFFTGLNPNKSFTRFIKMMAEISPQLAASNKIFANELASIENNGDGYERKYGINKETLELAESIKTLHGGFDPIEFAHLANSIGFSSVETSHEWFLGQARYSREGINEVPIQEYLSSVAPASNALYKYVSFVVVK